MPSVTSARYLAGWLKACSLTPPPVSSTTNLSTKPTQRESCSGLTSVEVAQLPELAQGEGLWRVNERAFVVRHLLTQLN